MTSSEKLRLLSTWQNDDKRGYYILLIEGWVWKDDDKTEITCLI